MKKNVKKEISLDDVQLPLKNNQVQVDQFMFWCDCILQVFFLNYPLVLHLPIPSHLDEVFFMIFVQTLNVIFFLWQ